jgi:hypothetical protein
MWAHPFRAGCVCRQATGVVPVTEVQRHRGLLRIPHLEGQQLSHGDFDGRIEDVFCVSVLFHANVDGLGDPYPLIRGGMTLHIE